MKRQTDGQTIRLIHKQSDRLMERQTEWTNTWMAEQTNRWTNGKRDGQKDR
jgi:hypothetical protein